MPDTGRQFENPSPNRRHGGGPTGTLFCSGSSGEELQRPGGQDVRCQLGSGDLNHSQALLGICKFLAYRKWLGIQKPAASSSGYF